MPDRPFHSEHIARGAAGEARVGTCYRAVREARAASEEVSTRRAGAPAEAGGDADVALAAAGERLAEVTRRYNEALLRCPE